MTTYHYQVSEDPAVGGVYNVEITDDSRVVLARRGLVDAERVEAVKISLLRQVAPVAASIEGFHRFLIENDTVAKLMADGDSRAEADEFVQAMFADRLSGFTVPELAAHVGHGGRKAALIEAIIAGVAS